STKPNIAPNNLFNCFKTGSLATKSSMEAIICKIIFVPKNINANAMALYNAFSIRILSKNIAHDCYEIISRYGIHYTKLGANFIYYNNYILKTIKKLSK